jgi:hypothetical protein
MPDVRAVETRREVDGIPDLVQRRLGGVNYLGPRVASRRYVTRRLVVVSVPSSLQWLKAVGMWAKAAAVGNAGRAAARCPRSLPVRRQAHRPHVHSLPGAKRPAPVGREG